jgi:hypothetical protein
MPSSLTRSEMPSTYKPVVKISDALHVRSAKKLGSYSRVSMPCSSVPNL